MTNMLAARLSAAGAPLVLERIARPVPPAGGALVRVEAAQVLPFTDAVLSGASPFDLPTPYTPGAGAVGVVEQVAPDVFGLEVGQRVFCDPYLPGELPGGVYAPLIIGWFGLSAAAKEAQQVWRDGSFAEYACFPAANCTPLYGLDQYEAERLACFNYLSIAHGGLRSGGLRPGQSVIVTGATGNLGAAAVLVALAMGAGRVVAAGRNAQALEQVAALDPTRVRAVRLDGPDRGAIAADLVSAADDDGHGADLFLDCVGAADTTGHVTAGIAALRPRGTAVLIGGSAGAVNVDYQQLLVSQLTIRGSFMAEPGGPAELAAMARSGGLRLDALRPKAFPLAQAAEAVQAARSRSGLNFTVLTCDGGASR